MNSIFSMLGIEHWKPILTALFLPPVPFLFLLLIGASLIARRRGIAWFIIALSTAGLWLSHTMGAGRWLEQVALHVPPALSAERIRAIRSEARAGSTVAIVVLGGGVEPLAPEYGTSNLGALPLERLRYGLWLSRETGAPVAFSGGIGFAQAQGAPAEADVAARIAAQDFGRPLRWIESQSRDTRENAINTVPLLKRAGITHIVLVTHGSHMPRARSAFDEAGAVHGVRIEAAPMGLAARVDSPALDWLPTTLGHVRCRTALREWLGRAMGA